MRIAIIGAGAMGSGIGKLLTEAGADVCTPLEGRSEQTCQRAAEAGMADATWADCAASDFILSIVAPSQATPAAKGLAGESPPAGRSPVFLECNAIHPDEARAIAGFVSEAGYRCVDGGIVGGSPGLGGGAPSPRFYVSGPDAPAVAPLAELGLAIEELDAPIGAASALKMSFAGISKGQTALLAMIALLAHREEVAGPLLTALRRTQSGLVAWGEMQLPQLHNKSARWVEEMEILSAMLDVAPGGPELFSGLRDFFEGISARDASDADVRLLTEWLADKD